MTIVYRGKEYRDKKELCMDLGVREYDFNIQLEIHGDINKACDVCLKKKEIIIERVNNRINSIDRIEKRKKYKANIRKTQRKYEGKSVKLPSGGEILINDLSKSYSMSANRIMAFINIHGVEEALKIFELRNKRGTKEYKEGKLQFIWDNRLGYLDEMEHNYNMKSPLSLIEDAVEELKERMNNNEYNEKLEVRYEDLLKEKEDLRLQKMQAKQAAKEAKELEKERKKLFDSFVKENLIDVDTEEGIAHLNSLVDDVIAMRRYTVRLKELKEIVFNNLEHEEKKNIELWLTHLYKKHKKDKSVMEEYISTLESALDSNEQLINNYMIFKAGVYEQLDRSAEKLKTIPREKLIKFKQDTEVKYLLEEYNNNILLAVRLNNLVKRL